MAYRAQENTVLIVNVFIIKYIDEDQPNEETIMQVSGRILNTDFYFPYGVRLWFPPGHICGPPSLDVQTFYFSFGFHYIGMVN